MSSILSQEVYRNTDFVFCGTLLYLAGHLCEIAIHYPDITVHDISSSYLEQDNEPENDSETAFEQEVPDSQEKIVSDSESEDSEVSLRVEKIIDPKVEANRKQDAELIRRAVAGEQSAFAQLQKKYVASITALVRRMLRAQPEDIEDIVQDTFIKAFQAIGSYNHDYAFSTWLYKIASNNCIDFLRKKRLRTISIERPFEGGDEPAPAMELPDHDYIPDRALHADERKAILQKAIEELPEKFRVVIHLRHEEELDYQEIADRLQLPLGTVKAHIFRARAMLYQRLKDHTVHFSDD